MKLLKQVPNLITLMNLSCGVLGIIFLLKGDFRSAIYLVFAAGAFDFMDGLAARLLKAYSEIGKSLDSLSDLVSFGVLPGVLAFYALVENHGHLPIFVSYSGIFIPAFSAIRLAIFNNDPEQKWNFRGLPTPANAFLIASAAYVIHLQDYSSAITAPVFLLIVLTGCILMVSNIRMFSLKFNPREKQAFQKTGVFLAIASILILLFWIRGMFLTILVYIVFSLVFSGKTAKDH